MKTYKKLITLGIMISILLAPLIFINNMDPQNKGVDDNIIKKEKIPMQKDEYLDQISPILSSDSMDINDFEKSDANAGEEKKDEIKKDNEVWNVEPICPASSSSRSSNSNSGSSDDGSDSSSGAGNSKNPHGHGASSSSAACSASASSSSANAASSKVISSESQSNQEKSYSKSTNSNSQTVHVNKNGKIDKDDLIPVDPGVGKNLVVGKNVNKQTLKTENFKQQFVKSESTTPP